MDASRTRLASCAVFGLAGLVTVAIGCGSDAERNAAAPAASSLPPTVTCGEKSSTEQSMTIHNLLPMEVRLAVSGIDCSEWSGVSTASGAWNGVSVASGASRTRRLEMAKGTSVSWTMTVSGGASGTIPVLCDRMTTTCGYWVTDAAHPDGVQRIVVGNAPSPSWAITDAQRAKFKTLGVADLALWSDGTKVYAEVSSKGGGVAFL